MVKILLFIGFQYLVHCLIHYELMWVKQCHKPSPSHHHSFRWHAYHFQMGGLWHCFTHTTRTTRNYMVKSINIYTHYKSINYGPIYELKNKLWTNNIRNYCTLEDHPIQELILQYLICWWVLYNTVYYYEPCQRKIYWKIIPFSGWLVFVGLF